MGAADDAVALAEGALGSTERPHAVYNTINPSPLAKRATFMNISRCGQRSRHCPDA
jgi:hypothetical protein